MTKKHETPQETLEERVARGIREGRLRAPQKDHFDWDEWRRLPRPEIDPDIAKLILSDLVAGRFR